MRQLIVLLLLVYDVSGQTTRAPVPENMFSSQQAVEASIAIKKYLSPIIAEFKQAYLEFAGEQRVIEFRDLDYDWMETEQYFSI